MAAVSIQQLIWNVHTANLILNVMSIQIGLEAAAHRLAVLLRMTCYHSNIADTVRTASRLDPRIHLAGK